MSGNGGDWSKLGQGAGKGVGVYGTASVRAPRVGGGGGGGGAYVPEEHVLALTWRRLVEGEVEGPEVVKQGPVAPTAEAVDPIVWCHLDPQKILPPWKPGFGGGGSHRR